MRLVKGLIPSVAVAACGAVASALPVFAAEIPSPYIQIGAGANWLEGIDVNTPGGTTPGGIVVPAGTSTLNFNAGPIVTGSVGYAFGNGLRGEFEFGYRESGGENLSLPNGATVGGSLNTKVNATAYSYMFQAIYDFSLGGRLARWSPHVGGGIGPVVLSTDRSPNSTVFGGQAIAGVEYIFSPTLRFGLDYRFLGTTSVHNNLAQDGFTVGRIHNTSYYDHAVLVTARWKFGLAPLAPAAGIAPAVLPAAPAGTTVPPPPPAAQDFTVLFATNSATLSREARDTVRRAANAGKANAPAHITVAGHTDTVGSEAANQKLSSRRADAVRKALIADGVPANEIETSAYGEKDLAVPTADNVNEQRNRRVVITVQGSGKGPGV